MDIEISPEIYKVMENKAKQGVHFLGVQMAAHDQIIFEFSDGSEIVISKSGVRHLPPSKGNP